MKCGRTANTGIRLVVIRLGHYNNRKTHANGYPPRVDTGGKGMSQGCHPGDAKDVAGPGEFRAKRDVAPVWSNGTARTTVYAAGPLWGHLSAPCSTGGAPPR